MSETILNKLEASRKELLDLGLRNPLLNYRVPASRGLQIVQERSSSVYDLLVRQQKSMTFLPKPVKENNKPAKTNGKLEAEVVPGEETNNDEVPALEETTTAIPEEENTPPAITEETLAD